MVDTDGRSTIVGHLCLEPIATRDAEMAIAVADAWQHRGLGRALLGQAIVWARDHGLERVSASMRCSNVAIIGLIRSTGLPVTFDWGDCGIVDAHIDVQATRPSAA